MFRPKNVQERTIHRLRIAKGQLEKVINMVEHDEYCINVIHQSQAIQQALKEIDNVLLENHLKTCALEHIQKGQKDLAIQEVVAVLRKRR